MLVGLALGCGRAPARPLRIAVPRCAGAQLLALAAERGFFRDEGVEVRLVEVGSLADERAADERGQIDVRATTVVEVIRARDRGPRDLQIIQILDDSDGADVILTHHGQRGLDGLRGGRVGVEAASAGDYLLARALAGHDLALADVHVIAADRATLLSAFRAGELDGVVSSPPTSDELLRATDADVAFSTRELRHELLDVLAADHALVRDRAADLARVVRAYQRAVAYLAAEPVEAHRIMAARLGLTPPELAAALADGRPLVTADGQAAYLGPGGTLPGLILEIDRGLRAAGQLTGPDRRVGAFTDEFVRSRPR